MSDHLLKDMADPQYRLWQEPKKNSIPRPTDKFLPERLLPYFGDIVWKKSGELTGLVCPKCGEDCYEVGHLWIKNEESLYPSQGTLWIFCSECFYVFSKNSSINYNE